MRPKDLLSPEELKLASRLQCFRINPRKKHLITEPMRQAGAKYRRAQWAIRKLKLAGVDLSGIKLEVA